MKRRAQAHSQSPPRDDWTTPVEVLDLVREVYPAGVFLDPATNQASKVGALHNFHRGRVDSDFETRELGQYRRWYSADGLEVNWRRFAIDTGSPEVDQLVFVNPPYGRRVNAMWADKVASEAAAGVHIMALVPASTDTIWFQRYWGADKVCFWRGRLRFGGGNDTKEPADFGSAVAYFGPRGDRFGEVFGRRGRVVPGLSSSAPLLLDAHLSGGVSGA